jgi:hypothetical protein
MSLSGQSDATALFSAVHYTLCDTYIDFPQSVNSWNSIFWNLAAKTHLTEQGLPRIVIYQNWWNFGKSSYADGNLPESHFDQSKPSYKSLSRWKWFYSMLLLWWCPFKIQKEKRAGLQFSSTDFLSKVSTPLRIRWTIPFIHTSLLPVVFLQPNVRLNWTPLIGTVSRRSYSNTIKLFKIHIQHCLHAYNHDLKR